MRNINIFETEMFPYLEGEEIKGTTLTLTIKDIKPEKMKSHAGKDQAKEVLYFKETKKGFVLNKTNSKRIAEMYGAQTGQWEGKKITLYTEEVAAFGQIHNALRVAPATPAPEEMTLEALLCQLNRLEKIKGFYKTPLEVLDCRAEGTGQPAPDDLDGWRTFFTDARDYAIYAINQALETGTGPSDDIEAEYPEIFAEHEEASE